MRYGYSIQDRIFSGSFGKIENGVVNLEPDEIRNWLIERANILFKYWEIIPTLVDKRLIGGISDHENHLSFSEIIDNDVRDDMDIIFFKLNKKANRYTLNELNEMIIDDFDKFQIFFIDGELENI